MERRHDIDVLRTLAFGLLILYHLAMVYVADWNYHFKSDEQYEWLEWPMVFVNRWRMSLLFLLSGIAVGLALRSMGTGRFAAMRTWRLFLPLVFGMLMIVPVQSYVEALDNGAIEPGFIAFMARYLQLQPWPAGTFRGGEHGVTWNHLWYLAYIWVYSLAVAAVLPLTRSAPGRWLGGTWASPANWHVLPLLVLPAAYVFVFLYWFEDRLPDTKALVGDWGNHAQYFPVFVFGVVVARSTRFWETLVARRHWTLAAATAGVVLYMGLRILGRTLSPESLSELPAWNWRAMSEAGHALYRWGMLLCLLGFAKHYLDRPYRWLPYANEAVYPWYILHQSLIIPLAFVVASLPVVGWMEMPLVLLGTVAGCALLHEFFIRRIPWLRPLFGLPIARRTRAITADGSLSVERP